MSLFENIKGISVASGFKLQAQSALDPREVVQSLEERNLLVTENGAYEGMKVYVKDEKQTYELQGTTNDDWVAVGGDVADDLAALQETIKELETSNAQAFKSFVVDAKTGVFTFTRNDGTTEEVDTLLEKVTVNFSYNEETGNIELELEDGTVQTVSLSKFVDVFTGVDGTTVEVAVSADNKISAEVKDGTITTAKLADEINTLLNQIVDGTTTQKGLVQLSDTVEDDSTKAATPKAVNEVKTVADAAAANATNAKTAADEALETANEASTTATTAKETAETASETATTANATATTAKETADAASETANAASETATEAKDTADTAKTTAEEAAAAAEEAQSTADTASEKADAAQETADGKTSVIWVEKGGSVPATAEANTLCFSIV